jgi:hypothetical protein
MSSERGVGLEKGDAEADPATSRGRPLLLGKRRYGDLRFRLHPVGQTLPGSSNTRSGGLMLLVTLLHGPGKLSVDHVLGKRFFKD